MLKDYFEKLYTGSQSDFFALADGAMDREERLFVVTANPEVMMIAQGDPALDAVLCAPSATIVPDGIGVVKAARGLGLELPGRVTGVELAWELIRHAGETGRRVYLYGAKEEVLQALAARVAREAPGALLVGAKNGYDHEDDEVFRDVLAQRPDVVLVALGVPRQELLIARWLERFDKGIFVGVGGSFDVLSGAKQRAPELFLRLNLEWLYRITKEPKRFGRFFRSNLHFLGKVRAIGRLDGR
ncbi:MAG: WecB/TagA/CpsF family glycosyltransferase [Oscillospiraceae bacterium]|nr:WecB/TagA/CpsF family glycosyltransferase [Oscillospiraceae bacterium]